MSSFSPLPADSGSVHVALSRRKTNSILKRQLTEVLLSNCCHPNIATLTKVKHVAHRGMLMFYHCLPQHIYCSRGVCLILMSRWSVKLLSHHLFVCIKTHVLIVSVLSWSDRDPTGEDPAIERRSLPSHLPLWKDPAITSSWFTHKYAVMKK